MHQFRGPPVPPRLQRTVRLQRRTMLLRLLPFHLGANLVSAPLTLAFFWTTHPVYAPALLNVIVTLVLGYGIFIGWRPSKALSRRAFITFNLALGLCWASLPVTVFPHGSRHEQTLVAGVIVALIATSLSVSPVMSGTISLAGVIIAGCVIALIRAWHFSPGPLYPVLLTELAIYAGFIFGLGQAVSVLLTRYVLASLDLAEQRDIVRLMLRRSDQSVGEWVWETDAEGHLISSVAALTGIIGGDVPPDGCLFLQELGGTAPASPQWLHLAHCMKSKLFFRDLAIPVIRNGHEHVLSLTGHPLFENGDFAGYRGVGADVTAGYREDQRASFRAAHDGLTGLPNRYAYDDALRTALVELSREHAPFALLAVDLDDFKGVNDSLGHAAGDRTLVEVTRRLQRCLNDKDTLFRTGGDELILIHHHATVDSAVVLAETMLRFVSEPLKIEETVVRPSISIGIALAPLAGSGESALQEAADLALYEAKRLGGNTFRVFEPSYRALADSRRDLIRDLREAVHDRRFELHYQPVINAQTRHLVGFEALARWSHPVLGPVPPDRFIRLAEEAGLMGELGSWLLQQACMTAIRWPDPLWVSVNISVEQLYHQNFISTLRNNLRLSGLPPERLQLEVTETIFMEADAATYGVLQSLQSLGVSVVLDDFGKGYSSLGYLRFFPFSKIKLDASFVRDMLSDSRSAAIVSAVIALAVDLGVAVTAEGVETPEYFERLRDKGCTEVQGYLFGRPMSQEKASHLVEKFQQTGSFAIDRRNSALSANTA
ncbi:EAL domain-containing protein [Acetobacter musti]|uniref:EAL domain-containing protein n=2 Tax=Acetobacter musti TaxID=864732 RepID=A0ABX0JUH1_9PROT|nr:EAL domain-containing protein [Acetobacter musti]